MDERAVEFDESVQRCQPIDWSGSTAVTSWTRKPHLLVVSGHPPCVHRGNRTRLTTGRLSAINAVRRKITWPGSPRPSGKALQDGLAPAVTQHKQAGNATLTFGRVGSAHIDQGLRSDHSLVAFRSAHTRGWFGVFKAVAEPPGKDLW